MDLDVPSIYSSARTELAKLLIYGLFRKIRVLAQDGEDYTVCWSLVGHGRVAYLRRLFAVPPRCVLLTLFKLISERYGDPRGG